MQFSSLVLYFLIANLSTKVAALYFYYDSAEPVQNLTRIEVTYDNEYSNDEGIFWSNQFAFQGGQGGYMGFQPRPNGPDHLVFSFFGQNATSESPYCSNGADGDPGISCMHEFEWIRNRNYTIAVELESTGADGSNLWQGTLQDEVTGEKLTIANFTLPATYQRLSSALITWLEWYSMNGNTGAISERFPCTPKASYSFWTPRYFKDGEEYDVKQTDYKAEGIYDGCAYEHNAPNQNVTAIPGGYYVQNGIFD
ncbi:hypothetical protein CLIB1423_04S01860 [[Candida] railenensis]|uniref:Uncharacterized protein n=1 Tax=[Candida] railenensis TaxID=45579 RepID=A0A9P0VXL7_9ASCO|nr:hypothetical protein CLIB1423_04S01860 [[Candida] railenensis]